MYPVPFATDGGFYRVWVDIRKVDDAFAEFVEVVDSKRVLGVACQTLLSAQKKNAAIDVFVSAAEEDTTALLATVARPFAPTVYMRVGDAFVGFPTRVSRKK